MKTFQELWINLWVKQNEKVLQTDGEGIWEGKSTIFVGLEVPREKG